MDPTQYVRCGPGGIRNSDSSVLLLCTNIIPPSITAAKGQRGTNAKRAGCDPVHPPKLADSGLETSNANGEGEAARSYARAGCFDLVLAGQSSKRDRQGQFRSFSGSAYRA